MNSEIKLRIKLQRRNIYTQAKKTPLKKTKYPAGCFLPVRLPGAFNLLNKDLRILDLVF